MLYLGGGMFQIKKTLVVGCLIFFTALGHTAPILKDMTGRHIAFSDLTGKWVLINYWASWCQPCLDEIPMLNHFYAKNKNRNIALYAVNYDALPVSEQKVLIKQLGIRYPSLQEDPAQALRLGDIRGVPATFVFNPKGKLTRILYGSQTLKSLERITYF